jgi:enoyl-[acyl-carrier protein] reductase I
MDLLDGKTALIFGIANKRSIAWGIAQAFLQQGATLGFSYAGEVLKRRVYNLAKSVDVSFVEPCDVTKDEEITSIVSKAAATFGNIDVLIHSIGYADQKDLQGPYYNTSRDGFQLAMDISVYSLTALTKAFLPLMRSGGSILAMTYYGGVKVAPNYNVMGVAKAALDASIRYLAYDLGEKNIRVNAISAGPIKTLAASGVSGFKDLYNLFSKSAPLKKEITIEDIGKTAVYLCSDMAAKTTGEVIYVDSGYNILAVPKI